MSSLSITMPGVGSSDYTVGNMSNINDMAANASKAAVSGGKNAFKDVMMYGSFDWVKPFSETMVDRIWGLKDKNGVRTPKSGSRNIIDVYKETTAKLVKDRQPVNAYMNAKTAYEKAQKALVTIDPKDVDKLQKAYNATAKAADTLDKAHGTYAAVTKTSVKAPEAMKAVTEAAKNAKITPKLGFFRNLMNSKVLGPILKGAGKGIMPLLILGIPLYTIGKTFVQGGVWEGIKQTCRSVIEDFGFTAGGAVIATMIVSAFIPGPGWALAAMLGGSIAGGFVGNKVSNAVLGESFAEKQEKAEAQNQQPAGMTNPLGNMYGGNSFMGNPYMGGYNSYGGYNQYGYNNFNRIV